MEEKINFKKYDKIYILHIALIIILIIFVPLQMIFRAPKINNENYENSNATYQVLLTMKAYDETPVSAHKFLPIVSLGEVTDKNIPWGATITDNRGNYYYTSFSAAGFIAPYIFVKLFHLPINETSLYIFNTILSIICCILAIIIFKTVFKEKISILDSVIFNVLIYLFQIEIMHTQGIVYWHQSLFQMLFLLQVILFLCKDNKIAMIGFFILCLINPYVEWTGYISNIGFVIAMFVEKSHFVRKQKIKLKTDVFLSSITIIILTILSLCMFSIHYLLVVSGKQFLNALLERFTARSLTKSGPGALLITYWQSYGFLLLFLAILLVIVLSMKNTREEFFLNIKRNKIIWIIVSFPLLENIILMQHASAYSFDRLKGIFILILLFFTLLITLRKKFSCKIKFQFLISTVLLAIAFFNVFQYVNYNTSYRWKADYLNENQMLANYLKSRFNGANSIFEQQSIVRGYNNLLFNRGIYEGAQDEDYLDFAVKSEKRFLVALSVDVNKSNIWNTDRYTGCKIYDLKENTLETVLIVDRRLQKDLKHCIIVSTITDPNWTNGISNKEAIILIRNNKFNRDNLKDAKALKSHYTIQNIKSVEVFDQWIHVNLANKDKIEQFASPNIVEVIK